MAATTIGSVGHVGRIRFAGADETYENVTSLGKLSPALRVVILASMFDVDGVKWPDSSAVMLLRRWTMEFLRRRGTSGSEDRGMRGA